VSEPKPKSFVLSKRAVWEAWLRVKANKGAAGVDERSITEFERDLEGNLYKLWNRLSSGSYVPPPMRAVEIPKRDGSPRVLGVSTVADRIAQTVVRGYLEPCGAVLPRRLLWVSAESVGAGRGRGQPGALLEAGLGARSGHPGLL
jgi:retron-type reverse transcriptase